MFERFTETARNVVIAAQQDARERNQGYIGSENLLISLYDRPSAAGAALLRQAGIERETIDADIRRLASETGPDPEALASIGIDLDAVRRLVEEAFGPGALERTRAAKGRWPGGHIPFDREAKKVLELSLREAIRIKRREIGTEHILLGLLHSGAGRQILAAHGITLEGMRAAVEELGRGQASG